jgi:uncharacterized membrane protein YdjX (TVP38/TMEM64 family)
MSNAPGTPILEETSPSPSASTKKGLWKPVALIAGVLVMLLVARYFGLDQYLKALQPWIESLGPLGPLAFIAIYVLASVMAIPGSPLTIAAGVLFGSFWGVVWVSLGSTAAAGACFLIARYVARESIEKNLKDNKQFQKLDDLTAEQGAFIVAIVRLLPIFPFNLLNYGFGLTRVPFITYLFWSWLCMLPGTILYVVGADAVKQAIAKGEIPWTLVAIVIVALAVLSGIGVLARKRLKSPQN